MKFTGIWHSAEMDEWGEDYCNIEVQAYLKFDREGGGYLLAEDLPGVIDRAAQHWDYAMRGR